MVELENSAWFLATSHQSCRASSPCPKDHLDLLTSQTSTRFWQTFSARVYLENQSPNFAAGASPLLMDTAMQRPGMQQRERLRLDCKGSVRVGVATNFQNIWDVHWVSQWLWIQPQRRSTATVVEHSSVRDTPHHLVRSKIKQAKSEERHCHHLNTWGKENPTLLTIPEFFTFCLVHGMMIKGLTWRRLDWGVPEISQDVVWAIVVGGAAGANFQDGEASRGYFAWWSLHNFSITFFSASKSFCPTKKLPCFFVPPGGPGAIGSKWGYHQRERGAFGDSVGACSSMAWAGAQGK